MVDRPVWLTSDRSRAQTDARAWSSRSDGREVVVLIEPDRDEAENVAEHLARRGVRTLAFDSPWRALAHLGAEPAAIVIVSARLGSGCMSEIVQAIKDERPLPVLIAYDPTDLGSIGPAVIAGGQPRIALPYRVEDVMGAIADVLPALPPPVSVDFGRLSIVPEWQDAHLDGRGLDVSPLEFKVLTELIHRRGRAVSREVLLASAWETLPADPKGSLGAALRRLRCKMAALGVPDAIETVRGVGYRLNGEALDVQGVGEPVAPDVPSSAIRTLTRAAMSSTMRRTS